MCICSCHDFIFKWCQTHRWLEFVAVLIRSDALFVGLAREGLTKKQSIIPKLDPNKIQPTDRKIRETDTWIQPIIVLRHES